MSDPSLHAAEWFGAIWTYIFRRKGRTFNEVYSTENRFKNRLTGYILQLLVLLSSIAFLFWLYK